MQNMFSKIFNTKKNNIKGLQTYYINTQYRDKYFGPQDYFTLSKHCFIENIIAFRAITMIAKSASSVVLTAYKNYNNGNKKELAGHQINNLLRQPSSKYGLAEFIEEIISYQLISGNAYIYVSENEAGVPTELQILRPDRIKILNNNDYLVYKYMINGLEYDFSDDENGICDILHLKNFHPLDDLYGLSSLSIAHKSIEQHNECLEWNKALLKNGARPSGAVVMNGNNATMSDDQFERIKSQINEQVSGGENAGKIMLLEGGLDWREMSMSPKDMDFIETKNGSARDISLALGVPPQLLGIPGDNTYSNMSEARMAFWEETVLPLLNNLCNKLSTWLSAQFMENIEINYDPDSISALSSQRQIIWQNVNNSTFLSDDEKRAMLGFSPNIKNNHS